MPGNYTKIAIFVVCVVEINIRVRSTSSNLYGIGKHPINLLFLTFRDLVLHRRDHILIFLTDPDSSAQFGNNFEVEVHSRLPQVRIQPHRLAPRRNLLHPLRAILNQSQGSPPRVYRDAHHAAVEFSPNGFALAFSEVEAPSWCGLNIRFLSHAERMQFQFSEGERFVHRSAVGQGKRIFDTRIPGLGHPDGTHTRA